MGKLVRHLFFFFLSSVSRYIFSEMEFFISPLQRLSFSFVLTSLSMSKSRTCKKIPVIIDSELGHVSDTVPNSCSRNIGFSVECITASNAGLVFHELDCHCNDLVDV